MSNKTKHKNVNNHIGEHCQTLVDDFFNFVDGSIDKVRIITEYRDISEPMPPKLEQIRKMLARCNKAWKDYCEFMMLPRESNLLFKNRVKKRWLMLEEKQKQIQKYQRRRDERAGK